MKKKSQRKPKAASEGLLLDANDDRIFVVLEEFPRAPTAERRRSPAKRAKRLLNVELADDHAVDDRTVPPPPREAWVVAAISGLCGLVLGLGSGWQIAIESAQVVGGVVSYQADNPFYMYHVKTWTLLHQIPALFLHWGMSERAASLIVSGLIGTISFQALALCCLAFSHRPFFSVFAPIFCLATNACSEASGLYPVQILSHDPWLTYGVMGASLSLLAWSLLGVGKVRTAAFLMGLAPAIHPTLGAWCLACGVASQIWICRNDFAYNRRFAVCLAAGLAIGVLSLVIHGLTAGSISNPDPAEAARLVAAFTAQWDSHRGAYPFDFPAPLMATAILLLGMLLFAVRPYAFVAGTLQLMFVLMLAAAGGLALAALTLWQDRLPAWLVSAMPGRYINLVGLAFAPFLLGLLARFLDEYSLRIAAMGLMIVGCLRSIALITAWFYIPPISKIMLVAACWLSVELLREPLARLSARPTVIPSRVMNFVLTGFRMLPSAALLYLSARWFAADTKFAILTAGVAVWAYFRTKLPSRLFGLICETSMLLFSTSNLFAGAALLSAAGLVFSVFGATTFAFGLAFFLVPVPVSRFGEFSLASVSRTRLCLFALTIVAIVGLHARAGYAGLEDWRNSPVYAAAAEGEGLLLTCPRMRLVQLRTRRPLVISCFGINQITYVPESAVGINRVLDKIYGEDLAAPRPADWKRRGGLAPDTGRDLWENRGRATWAALGREFGFTQVLTIHDWRLDLPIVAEDENMKLYAIPSEGPASSGAANVAAQ